MSAIVREGSIRELIENERARSAAASDKVIVTKMVSILRGPKKPTEVAVSSDDLHALVAGWRRAPLPELVIRCRALAMADQRNRLPTEVYDAWVQMSAVVTVFGGGK